MSEQSGIAHHLTSSDLEALRLLNSQGKTSEAWAYLAQKGDAYAVLAADVVRAEPESIVGKAFHHIVEVQWNNTVGGDIYNSPVFGLVAQSHLDNYISFLESSPAWPTTTFIERSYKEALQDNGLVPEVAIDGLISVIQYHAKFEISWADIMGLGNRAMGSDVEWQDERIVYSSDVFVNEITLSEAIAQFESIVFGWGAEYVGGFPILMESIAPFGIYVEPVSRVLYDATNVEKVFQGILMVMLFQKFSGDTDVSDIRGMMDSLAGGEDESYGYNRALEKLAAVLGVSISSDLEENESLKNAFGSLRIYLDDNPGIYITNLVGVSPDDIASLASDEGVAGVSYRYALQALNPFAIGGLDYSELNMGHSLDLYDPATGVGMTEQYISDRARMLGVITQYGLSDLAFDEDFDTLGTVGNFRFSDIASGVSLYVDGLGVGEEHVIGFGGAGGDLIEGGGVDDSLYGAGGGDTLIGGEGSDYLEGGVGSDNLQGGEDNDILNGGAGDDRYLFSSGDGNDLIIDADGTGSLWLDDKQLSGGKKISDNVYFDESSGWTYIKVDADLLLTSTGGSESIRIIGWEQSSLGKL